MFWVSTACRPERTQFHVCCSIILFSSFKMMTVSPKYGWTPCFSQLLMLTRFTRVIYFVIIQHIIQIFKDESFKAFFTQPVIIIWCTESCIQPYFAIFSVWNKPISYEPAGSYVFNIPKHTFLVEHSFNSSLIVTNPYWCEHQLSQLFSFWNLSCSFHVQTSFCIYMNSSPTAALSTLTHLKYSVFFFFASEVKKKKEKKAGMYKDNQGHKTTKTTNEKKWSGTQVFLWLQRSEKNLMIIKLLYKKYIHVYIPREW